MSASEAMLVTGAGNGLGKEMVTAAAQRGMTVFVNDVDADAAQSVADEITARGGTAHPLPGDVTSEESVEAMAGRVRELTGRLDILVNNAGIFELPVTATVDQDVSRFRRILDVCLTGTFVCAQRMAAEFFLPQGYGRIVNISSISGVGGLPMRNAYSTSKAGVIMLTRTLASEWAAHGVTVNAVAPGYIATDAFLKMQAEGMLDDTTLRRRIPKGQLGRAHDIAHAVLFLASREAEYLTGACLPVDGGWSAFGGSGDAFDVSAGDVN